jgi:hypothetical protein
MLENPEEAERVLHEALLRAPEDPRLAVRRAVAIVDSGDLQRARGELVRVLAKHPADSPALAAMCALENAQGNMPEALRYAQQAVHADPAEVVAHQNLALTLLKLGNLEQGWDEYEWRRHIETSAGAYARFRYPEWDGESISGKTILVYPEQGLGDEIMFASCLPDLLAANHLVLECDPRLESLFRRSFSDCAVFGRERTIANNWISALDPQPDLQIPIGSLPRFLRRRVQDFPSRRAYLYPDPQKVAQWRRRLGALGPGRKLGLSWRGGLLKTGRARRSIELGSLSGLMALPGIRFVSLQYDAASDEVDRFTRLPGAQLVHWQEGLADYDETAALVCALDGVISVCTAIVHLTGALGRPALVMAPLSPEWRYAMSAETMLWYPSVRIVRQARPGDWSGVLARVIAELEAGWGSTQ